MQIIQATSVAEIDQARALMSEYVAWLNIDLAFQRFDDELAALPGAYAPPWGRLLLAEEAGRYAGCVALRPLDAGVCEMKRLYVRPAYRGRHLGRQLAETIITEARAIGYRRMRLDTANFLVEAQALYRSLGFREIAPYYQLPIALLPQVTFMELTLQEEVR
jgi:ribosomal protein S18 acetylase RimI-like enzyme